MRSCSYELASTGRSHRLRCLMMDPTGYYGAIGSLLTALIAVFFLVKLFGAPAAEGRYAGIDGLRGFLAFFVFLHHSAVWYFYLQTGRWEWPPSNLFVYFGPGSVMLFFMVTGFLFFSKLLDARSKPLDWRKLYVSRFLRIGPLYLFAVLFVFLIAAWLTHGVMNETPLALLKSVVRWLGLGALGTPNLNGLEHTDLIIAGVLWTLPYEWFFYFSLPLLALPVGVKTPRKYIVFACVSAVAFWLMARPELEILLPFASGIVTAMLVRTELVRKLSAGTIASVVIVLCLVAAVVFYRNPRNLMPQLLLFVVFCLIAGGNDLFGILRSAVARTFGDISYSIYLLHGILLYVTFNFVVGIPEAKSLSPLTYWLIVTGLGPCLTLISFTTYRLIERPAMQGTARTSDWLQACLGKLKMSKA